MTADDTPAPATPKQLADFIVSTASCILRDNIIGAVADAIAKENAGLRAELEHARQAATIMLHAYEHDTRPPAATCLEIRTYATAPTPDVTKGSRP